jgi:hypothetical protein
MGSIPSGELLRRADGLDDADQSGVVELRPGVPAPAISWRHVAVGIE